MRQSFWFTIRPAIARTGQLSIHLLHPGIHKSNCRSSGANSKLTRTAPIARRKLLLFFKQMGGPHNLFSHPLTRRIWIFSYTFYRKEHLLTGHLHRPQSCAVICPQSPALNSERIIRRSSPSSKCQYSCFHLYQVFFLWRAFKLH